MAPLPPNNTARLFLDYTSNGVQHTMCLRTPGLSGTAGDYADAYAAIFAQVMLDSDSFYGARYSAAGTDFSVPIEFAAIEGDLGPETTKWSQDPESAQLSFIMRDFTEGRRGRIELFTPVALAPWPTDNRYNSGEQSTVTDLLTDFQAAASASGSFPLRSIAGEPVTVYGYVNIRLNAYWQNQQRL